MLKIGEFSKVTGVPAKTIRYYEDIGLIKPAEVDSWTGYRRYDEKNVEEILKILYLKEIGFKLAEIKNFDDSMMKKKKLELKSQLEKIKQTIKDISNLYKNEKGELIMKQFINDENLIGKWKFEGISYTKEELEKGEIQFDSDFGLNELVFLPNGENIWVIDFWTKGHIFIKGVPMAYEIKNDKLIIAFDYDASSNVEFYAVFKNVDHKKYTKDEVTKKDNVDMDFVLDEDFVGVWKVCDFIKNIDDFDPKKEPKSFGFYDNLCVLKNGELIFTLENGEILKANWTKGFILRKKSFTAEKYLIKEINDEKYLFMEHKSGDYLFGGMKPFFYVFKKESK